MTDDDDLLAEMVDTVMSSMFDSFLELWQRPGAAQLLEAWLDGRCLLVCGRHGVEVRLSEDGQPFPVFPAQ